jgi:hypothetical protein
VHGAEVLHAGRGLLQQHRLHQSAQLHRHELPDSLDGGGHQRLRGLELLAVRFEQDGDDELSQLHPQQLLLGLRPVTGARGLRNVAGALALLGFVLFAACTAEHSTAAPTEECRPFQFRACQTDACRGVEQCLDPGYWSQCDCVIVDASYGDAPADGGQSDADVEGGPD